jgi:cytochrome c oxidase subunit 2
MRGIQSALEPAGVHAEKIGALWDIFLVVSAIVYVLVLLFLFIALRRKQSEETKGVRTGVTIATGITVVALFALLVSSVVTGRAIAYAPAQTIDVTVTGRQWWWQVDYEHPADQSKRFTSANELVIPVGVPVQVKLRSTDVIHSFWIPNLHGKQDLIPGHENAILLQATKAGVYRGQCAEFCGLQHAKMALWVTAVPLADFAKWAEQQRQPSKIPSTPQQRKGEEVFMSSPCPLCHNVQGTNASGKTGPDLTHFGSRRSIAAGALPNHRAHLAGWILDPQRIKPGVYMPPTALKQGELEPLLAYVESLK